MKHFFLVLLIVVTAWGSYWFLQAGLSADETKGQNTGVIRVTVVDEDNERLRPATVSVRSSDGKIATTVTVPDATTQDYLFQLPNGTYDIVATASESRIGSLAIDLGIGQIIAATIAPIAP